MNIAEKFLYNLMRLALGGKLDPVEGTLAFSAIAHGLLLLADFSNASMVFSPSGEPGGIAASRIVGLGLFVSGLLVVLANHGKMCLSRQPALLAQFTAWAALFVAVCLNPFSNVVVNFGYGTIAIIAATIYLVVATGDGE